jgi:hypothetical protein
MLLYRKRGLLDPQSSAMSVCLEEGVLGTPSRLVYRSKRCGRHARTNMVRPTPTPIFDVVEILPQYSSSYLAASLPLLLFFSSFTYCVHVCDFVTGPLTNRTIQTTL